ncbi:MAG: hypothetical protein HWN51_02920, partial [Desulfobacterales bacterium]|nr:hypothetical protein [Desulfobacterales bacterium]
MFDLIVIVGYFSFMLFVDWCSRRQSAESYWVAERSYYTGRITTSLVATIFGASSTMGIISSLLLGYTVFVGGVVFPTPASFYRQRLKITSKGALWAIVVGGSTAILGKIH